MLQKIKECFLKSDYIMLSLALTLSIVGITAIYSAGYDPSTTVVQPYYSRQILWLCIGVVLFFVLSVINYQRLVEFAPYIYAFGIVLLVLVLVSGVFGMGAKRWLGIGSLKLQPSEIFKTIWVITLAWTFFNVSDKPLSFTDMLKKSFLLLPPFLLVFLQPDLGTSLTYLAVWGIMVLILGVSRFTIIFFLIIAVVGTPLLWSHMKDYQKKRVITFINPEKDPFGAGYHIIQSKIGVGSGGINGKGYLKGTQSHLRFIPERHTDFIYSVINEEAGFIGGITVISLFVLLLLRIVQIGLRAKEPAGKLLSIGVASYIFFQFTVNAYMTVGMMPVVGIPMPFVSYGGSSLMSFFAMLGIMNSIHVRRFMTSNS